MHSPLDTDALLAELIRLKTIANSNGFGCENRNVALRYYAQAGAFDYVISLIFAGEFDLMTDDTTIN
jgi:hypothetical protein